MNTIQTFEEINFVWFRILTILYMYKEIPEVILSVNFGPFGENFVTSIIYPVIKPLIMEEACGGWSLKMQKNFRS